MSLGGRTFAPFGGLSQVGKEASVSDQIIVVIRFQIEGPHFMLHQALVHRRDTVIDASKCLNDLGLDLRVHLNLPVELWLRWSCRLLLRVLRKLIDADGCGLQGSLLCCI